MEARLLRPIWASRVERLKAHIENVGDTPGFQRELARAEAKVRELEQQEEQPRSA